MNLLSLIVLMSFAAVNARAADLPGMTVFDTMKCGGCHVNKAKGTPTGNPGMAKILSVDVQKLDLTQIKSDTKDADLRLSIEKGKNKMPGYSKKIKPEDIDALVAYVKSLAAPSK